jgi:hypothetical protein
VFPLQKQLEKCEPQERTGVAVFGEEDNWFLNRGRTLAMLLGAVG